MKYFSNLRDKRLAWTVPGLGHDRKTVFRIQCDVCYNLCKCYYCIHNYGISVCSSNVETVCTIATINNCQLLTSLLCTHIAISTVCGQFQHNCKIFCLGFGEHEFLKHCIKYGVPKLECPRSFIFDVYSLFNPLLWQDLCAHQVP